MEPITLSKQAESYVKSITDEYGIEESAFINFCISRVKSSGFDEGELLGHLVRERLGITGTSKVDKLILNAINMTNSKPKRRRGSQRKDTGFSRLADGVRSYTQIPLNELRASFPESHNICKTHLCYVIMGMQSTSAAADAMMGHLGNDWDMIFEAFRIMYPMSDGQPHSSHKRAIELYQKFADGNLTNEECGEVYKLLLSQGFYTPNQQEMFFDKIIPALNKKATRRAPITKWMQGENALG